MSIRPDDQVRPDLIRQGPLCGTCPSAGTGTACTDCSLRAGVHVRQLPATAFLPKEPPRWAIYSVIGSLLTLFVLGSLLTAVDRTVFGPAGAVDDFFSALQDRDAGKVAARTSPGLGLISTRNMLADRGYRPPSGWRTRVVDGGFHAAKVEVTYTVEGRRLQQELLVDRIGYRGGLFSRWSIKGSMPTLDVIMPDTGLVVAGQMFPGDTDLRNAAVLPGSYRVQVPKNPLVTLDRQIVAVPAADRTDPPVLAEIGAGARGAAGKALKALLLTCEGSLESAPEGCPFQAGTDCGADTPVTWSTGRVPGFDVVQRPEAATSADPTAHSTLFLANSKSGYMNYRQDCGFGAYQNAASIDLTDWGVTISGNEVVLIDPQSGSD